jgi:hypothetical protein
MKMFFLPIGKEILVIMSFDAILKEKEFLKQLCETKSLEQEKILVLWISEDVLAKWKSQVGQKLDWMSEFYTDFTIEFMLAIKENLSLGYRQTQNLVEQLFVIFSLELPVPHYATFCRRASKSLKKDRKTFSQNSLRSFCFLSIGLMGLDETKSFSHFQSSERLWRKVILKVDLKKGQIQHSIMRKIVNSQKSSGVIGLSDLFLNVNLKAS